MHTDLHCFTVAFTNDFVHSPKNPSNAISMEHNLDSNLGCATSTGKHMGQLLASPCRASVMDGEYFSSAPTDSQTNVKR